MCPGVRPNHIPLGQSRGSFPRITTDPGDRMRTGRHRAARGGSLRPRAHLGKPQGHPGGNWALPARQRPGGHRRCDRRLRPLNVTDGAVEDYWEHAPCGQVIADPDGRMIRVNATLLRWLGYEPNTLCGKPFTDLLTVSGRMLYDTHFGPLLNMGGDLNGVTVDVVTADGTRLPMFLTANVKSDAGQKPQLLRISVVDAADRRAYEADLLQARQQAENEQRRVR